MKKITVFLLALSLLAGCNSNEAFENAIKDGKKAIINEDYGEAAVSFEAALEEKSDDEVAKILLSQTEKMIDAIDEEEDGNIEDAIALFEEVKNMEDGYGRLSEQAKERREALVTKQVEIEKYDGKLEEAEALKGSGKYEEAKELLGTMISETEDVEYLEEQHERATEMLAEVEDATDEEGQQEKEEKKGINEEGLTEEQAIEMVKSYFKSQHPDMNPDMELYYTVEGMDGDGYVIHVYEIVDNGPEDRHTATYGWFNVNKYTGEIKDITY